MSKLDIPNVRFPATHFACGGQPTERQLETAAELGWRRVINLRAPTEPVGYNEELLAQQLGLDYFSLPVAGAKGLNREVVRRLHDLAFGRPVHPTIIHCASGNRVGALMALRAGWVLGQPSVRAMEVGHIWGLTTLAPEVLERLITQ